MDMTEVKNFEQKKEELKTPKISDLLLEGCKGTYQHFGYYRDGMGGYCALAAIAKGYGDLKCSHKIYTGEKGEIVVDRDGNYIPFAQLITDMNDRARYTREKIAAIINYNWGF